MNKTISPSRNYVALRDDVNHTEYHFELPEFDFAARPYSNDSDTATWYYRNCLYLTGRIKGCIAKECLNDLSPSQELLDKLGDDMRH